MKRFTFYAIFAYILWQSVRADDEDNSCITPGEEWADRSIKKVCSDYYTWNAVACLPTKKIGELELTPGNPGPYWSDGRFKYQCNLYKDDDKETVAFEIKACILPNGLGELEVDKDLVVTKRGLWRCISNPDGTVSRRLDAGCYVNNRLYRVNQAWDLGSGRVVCIAGNGGFEIRAQGCIVPGVQDTLLPGTYIEHDGKYYKCQAGDAVAYELQLLTVSQQEYEAWQAIVAGGEEESASGDSGTGFINRPTTTAAPPPPPHPAARLVPEEAELVRGPSAALEDAIEAAPPSPVASLLQVEDDDDSVLPEDDLIDADTVLPVPAPSNPGSCKDLHPVCKTLCARSCSYARDTEEPIGLALKRGFDKRRSFSKKAHKVLGKLNQKIVKPIASALGFGQGSGSSESNEKSSNSGGASNGGLSLALPSGLALGGGLGFGGGLPFGRPFGSSSSHGGKWSASWHGSHSSGSSGGSLSSGSSSNSGSSSIGSGGSSGGFLGLGGKPSWLPSWHIPGFGSSGSQSFGGSSSITTGSAGSSQQSGDQCSKFGDFSIELINAFCPESCGVCGNKRLLPPAGNDIIRIAQKWAASSCFNAAQVAADEAVGFALDEKPEKRGL